MMVSMTGFGKSFCELKNKTVTIEVKSLNSKQLDIYTRLPNKYKDKDIDIRNLLSQKLKRGKIDLCITIENSGIAGSAKINDQVVRDYYKQLTEIADELKIKLDETIISTIMRFPDALITCQEEIDEEEWEKVIATIEDALIAIDAYRVQEGKALEADILGRIDIIVKQLISITPFEEDRIQKIREKLLVSISELPDKEKIDSNRFEQELIYYLEKLDITEEKIRLKNHCDFFIEVSKEEMPAGKKLGFIAQEMGREINTIGSKANHSEIQKIVVQMKDELEKIKEQLNNIL
jgi:uncharacterized protein (TIGR00255 family)